ncbi:MAG: formylglycine-generating enzyme family protein [Planctomycetota bacterium]|nr:formylglycine-generating enzyme family protein [Planctomycetales bacterium]RLS44906.1 MAG: formylglycine-generating enzyme family protein [Planctomycetota bacterium]
MTPFTTSSLRVSHRVVQGLAFATGLCAIAAFSGAASSFAADAPAADTTAAKTPAEMKPYKQDIRNTDVSYEMVPIPGGEFVMGSPAKETNRGEGEGPQHKVKIEPFWMGKYEVTWEEFELWSLRMERSLRNYKKAATLDLEKAADAITKPTNPYTDMSFGMGKDERQPAICMTQHAAKMYCQWLSAKTGHYYRLPTEAEWEYACRAGTTTAYHFGDDVAKLDDYAWHEANSDGKYKPIGKKKPNPWGLYDMHGNAAEWVQDKFDPEFYAKFPADKSAVFPLNIGDVEYPRTARGGAWNFTPEKLRSAARLASEPAWKEQDPNLPKSAWYMTDALFVGFRIIRPFRVPTAEERKNLHLDAVLPTDAKERITIED